MTLKERINEDMKTAMRSGEKDRLAVIRLLQAAIKQREVDERITLDDAQVRRYADAIDDQRAALRCDPCEAGLLAVGGDAGGSGRGHRLEVQGGGIVDPGSVGIDRKGRANLVGIQAGGPLVKLTGSRVVPGEQGDPAQAGELEGHVWPQLQILGDARLAVACVRAHVQVLHDRHGREDAPSFGNERDAPGDSLVPLKPADVLAAELHRASREAQ